MLVSSVQGKLAYDYFRNVESNIRLCQHVLHPGGKKVSKCWPGLDCGAALGNFSYLLFLDTCVEGAGGRRHCTTQFVKNCPHLEQRSRIENQGEEQLHNHHKKSIIETSQIKLPRIVKENNENSNEVIKPVKRLILGLKSNKWDEKRNWKRSENFVQDGNLKIVREDINPNIVVRYLNKKENRDDSTENDEPENYSEEQYVTFKEPLDFSTIESGLILESSTEYVTTEAWDMTETDNMKNKNSDEKVFNAKFANFNMEEENHTNLEEEVLRKPMITEMKDNAKIIIENVFESITEEAAADAGSMIETDVKKNKYNGEKALNAEFKTNVNMEKENLTTLEEQVTKIPMITEMKGNIQFIDDEHNTLENVFEGITTPKSVNISVEKIDQDDIQKQAFNENMDGKQNTILINNLNEILESRPSNEIDEIQIVEDFNLPDLLSDLNSGSNVRNISGDENLNKINKELIDIDLNKDIYNKLQVEENNGLNINYILDVLKDIKISDIESTGNVKDITDEYNVRKKIEDGIGKQDEQDKPKLGQNDLVESGSEEYFGLDIEYEENEDTNVESIFDEKTTSANDNIYVENTTVDMYAGDVDILFGL